MFFFNLFWTFVWIFEVSWLLANLLEASLSTKFGPLVVSEHSVQFREQVAISAELLFPSSLLCFAQSRPPPTTGILCFNHVRVLDTVLQTSCVLNLSMHVWRLTSSAWGMKTQPRELLSGRNPAREGVHSVTRSLLMKPTDQTSQGIRLTLSPSCSCKWEKRWSVFLHCPFKGPCEAHFTLLLFFELEVVGQLHQKLWQLALVFLPH